MKVLCKRDFTPFYKEKFDRKPSEDEDEEDGKGKPYELGSVYNQDGERVRLNELFSNVIRKGEKADQDLIRSQYNVLYSPNEVFALKNLKVRPHPVVACYCTAYSEHYPLIISPDHIWMMITQGLVKHLAVRPELIGSVSSGIETKKDITVEMPKHINQNSGEIDWEGVVNEIHQDIVEDVAHKGDERKAKLLDFLDHNFSTSTQVEKVAAKMLMMEAFKDFYSYKNDFMCGLPSVSILGTLDDWLGMREKVKILDEYDMKWWRKALTLILDKIIKTAQEETVTEELKTFWNAIALFDSASGVDYISGWINYFFPYDKKNRISHHLERFIEMDSKFNEEEPFVDDYKQVDIYDCPEEDEENVEFVKLAKLFRWREAFNVAFFPHPITTTSVQVLNHPKWKEFCYISGFLGVDYNPELDGMLPVISWVITTPRNEVIRENIISRCKFDHAPWSIDCGRTQWKASISLSYSVVQPEIVIPTNDEKIYSNSKRMIEMFTEIKEHMENKYKSDVIDLEGDVKYFTTNVVQLLAPKGEEALVIKSAKACGLSVLNQCEDGRIIVPFAYLGLMKGEDCCLVFDWSTQKPLVGVYLVHNRNFIDAEPLLEDEMTECCSGTDFTNNLLKYLEEKHHISFTFEQGEKAKINLSTSNSTIIEGSNSSTIEVTREEFNTANRKELDIFESILKKHFSKPLVSNNQTPVVDHVIISGGSCNIPKVKDIVQSVAAEVFPNAKLISNDINPYFVQSLAGANFFRGRQYEALQYMNYTGGEYQPFY